MGEGTIKQKGCGECTTARNDKDNFDLYTVKRRTTTRDFPSSIWEEDQRAKDELRHAVRSFLRICLIAKASLHRACQICQGLYTGLLAYP